MISNGTIERESGGVKYLFGGVREGLVISVDSPWI